METKKIVLLSVAALLISFSIYFFFTHTSEPKVDLSPYLAIADGAVEETKKALGGKGSIVLIVEEEADLYRQRNQRFEKLIKKEGIVIEGKEMIPKGELSVRGQAGGGVFDQDSIPADKFLAYMEKYPRAQGFVSFVGPPAFLEEHFEKIPAGNSSKIIVCGSVRMALGLGVKELLLAKKIHVAIYPRSDRGKQDDKSLGMLDIFRKYYQVYTPETAETFGSYSVPAP